MFKKILKLLTVLIFTSSALAGEIIKINTAQGEAEVPKNPKKIAVLDLGVLDNLEALGVTAGAVNNTLFVQSLEEKYKKTPRIGTLHEPNFEKIIAYQPDLIIVAARSANSLDTLKDIAPTIDMSIKGDNLIENSKSRLIEFGKIFDKSHRAEKIIVDLNKKLEELKTLTKGKGKALLILTTGPKISTYGKESRLGWIHNDLGIAEAIENVKEATHGEPISFEFIKEANPEWLIVLDRGTAIGSDVDSAKTVLNNAIVAETPAWKKQKIIYLDAAIYLAIGGITGIEKTIDTVADAYRKAN